MNIGVTHRHQSSQSMIYRSRTSETVQILVTEFLDAVEAKRNVTAEAADISYRKSSIKPPGGLFNFWHSRGGLIREGAY